MDKVVLTIYGTLFIETDSAVVARLQYTVVITMFN